ncbi:MAG TPA: hypothetical protein PKH31_13640, partial [Candidatus Sumerlaeota bacterium]|nr:hypothetical protein [Candidatus Sumerlaeota bacterium]
DTGGTKPGDVSRIPDRSKDTPSRDTGGTKQPGEKSRVPSGSVFERDRKGPDAGGVSERVPSDRKTPGRDTGGVTGRDKGGVTGRDNGGVTGRREPGSRVEPGTKVDRNAPSSSRILERPGRKDLPTSAAMREVPRPALHSQNHWSPPKYHDYHNKDDYWHDYWHSYWHESYHHHPKWSFSTCFGFGSWGFSAGYGGYNSLSFWCGAPAYPTAVYMSPVANYNYGWPYATNYSYFYTGPYAYSAYRPYYRTVTYYEPAYYSVDYYSAPWYEGVYYEPTPWFYGPAYSDFSFNFSYVFD